MILYLLHKEISDEDNGCTFLRHAAVMLCASLTRPAH